jgi:hypothetical protein
MGSAKEGLFELFKQNNLGLYTAFTEAPSNRFCYICLHLNQIDCVRQGRNYPQWAPG